MGLNNYSQDLSQFVWIYLLKLNLMRKIIILCHIPEDFLWKLVLENIFGPGATLPLEIALTRQIQWLFLGH